MTRNNTSFVERQLPEPTPAPTVVMYADQLRRFRDTLTECMAFIEAATGIPPREQFPLKLASWLMENVSMEAAAKYDQLSAAIMAGVFRDDD